MPAGNHSVDCLPMGAYTEPCLNGTAAKQYTCGAVLECGPSNYKLFDLGYQGRPYPETLILLATDEVSRIDKCLLDWNYEVSLSSGRMIGISPPCEYRAHPGPSSSVTHTITNQGLRKVTSGSNTMSQTTAHLMTVTYTPDNSSSAASVPSIRSAKISLTLIVLVFASTVALTF